MLVLVFSSYLLFQNVYTTFKALKPPKPSRKAKNGVDPAVKAKAARKRELKGMLACWIVWVCRIDALVASANSHTVLLDKCRGHRRPHHRHSHTILLRDQDVPHSFPHHRTFYGALLAFSHG